MDPYEILGIRPSAKSEEIELAYKGRRSQYHPDRYSQSDAETQAWATTKMQEVNEAYRVLASPALRSQLDQGQSSTGAKREKAQPARATTQGAIDVASVLLKPEWEWFHDKVYARPNIPHKKLEGAIASYAPGVAPEAVLVLLDDTLFGGAREGLLVATDGLHCKQKLASPRHIAFDQITEVAPGTNCRLMVNGREFFKADLIEHLAMLMVAGRLAEALKNAQRVENGECGERSNIESIEHLHRVAMSALQSEWNGDAFLIDQLIDQQMRSLVERCEELRRAIDTRKRGLTAGYSNDAAMAELALVLFLMLHYYGLTKIEGDFRAVMEADIAQLQVFSEAYKNAYRAEFLRLFGYQMEVSEHELEAMAGMLLGRNDAESGALDEVLGKALALLGVRRQDATQLVDQFVGRAEFWLASIFALVSR